MYKAVILDADTMGDVDFSPIREEVSELTIYPTTSAQQLHDHIAGAELIITNKVVIGAEVMGGLKGILVVATGTNNIDMAAAAERNIPVLNVKNYGTDSVAQHTMMLMLSLAGRLPVYQQDLKNGAWQQSPFFCLLNHATTQLSGKTLVIVGQGALGSAVAKLAQAFAMNVVFAARPGFADDQRPDFISLLAQADVISFHCPLNDHTHHLLNSDNLGQVKPGALVVNCARGGVIDEEAALQALKTGRLGGLAVDVLPQEPPSNGHPLLDAMQENLNLIVTPHNAWISPQARQKIVQLTAENIRTLSH